MVHPAVHVGVHPGVVLVDSLQDLLGFLRGRGVVQVHEGSPVHLLVQDGELVPETLPERP